MIAKFKIKNPQDLYEINGGYGKLPLNNIHSPAIAITRAKIPKIQSSRVFVSIILGRKSPRVRNVGYI
jgi:hypothetical protein